jgi:hypothetical protein
VPNRSWFLNGIPVDLSQSPSKKFQKTPGFDLEKEFASKYAWSQKHQIDERIDPFEKFNDIKRKFQNQLNQFNPSKLGGRADV